MSLSLISSVLWVPRGVSASHPRKYDLSDPAELERVQRLGKIKLDDARRELEELEAGVDGMAVDETANGEDGDEWESDSNQSDSEEDDDMDEATKKARKMAQTIKGGAANNGESNEEDEMKKYNLDNYDNELNKSSNLGIFSNIKGLSYYASGPSGAQGEDSDPYVTLTNPKDEDDTIEREELEILPTDNLLISAKTTEEVSLLEVHVYEGPEDEDDDTTGENDTDGNLYVHHDTLLPAMPLCMEWGDCRPSTSAIPSSSAEAGGSKGSFVAVGTLDKTIEIWDLDVVEGMFPEAILGDLSEEELKEEEEKLQKEREQAGGGSAVNGEIAVDAVEANGEKQKKKKKKKKKNANSAPEEEAAPITILPYAHTDSILSLSWNRSHRSLLASSSADSTIKLWDLSSPTCHKAIRSFSLFSESGSNPKVQSVTWNPTEPSILLAGAWGGGIRVFDTRSPESALKTQLPIQKGARGMKKSNPDVEVAHWDHFNPTNFYIASGNGQVLFYDSRMLSSSVGGEQAQPVWTLDAHDGPCSALDVNEFVKGCIVTGGVDKQTKIWNVQPEDGKGISLVTSRDFGVGKVFSTLFSPDDPTTLALAGSAARLQIWDAFSNAGFRKVFGDRLRETSTAGGRIYKEGGRRARGNGLVGVGEDGNNDESDDD